jgi:hypothetical protein
MACNPYLATIGIPLQVDGVEKRWTREPNNTNLYEWATSNWKSRHRRCRRA